MNEPGTLIWNELITDNGEAAYAFYDERRRAHRRRERHGREPVHAC